MLRSSQVPISIGPSKGENSFSKNVHNMNKMPIFGGSPMNIEGNDLKHESSQEKDFRHLYVLPVLLLEFLALALTRAVLPAMLLHAFKENVYFIMGCVEFVRGLLAFVMCPLFGKISDVVGRRTCLFITVLGTCAPVCSLAFMHPITSSPFTEDLSTDFNNTDLPMTVTGDNEEWIPMESVASVMSHTKETVSVYRIYIFVTLLAISGMFSSTFPLTFAYVSDTVKVKEDRVAAYGLALATFGLSFTIGPMAGGYLARVENGTNDDATNDDDSTDLIRMADPIGQQRVFFCTLVLTLLDLLYIYFILPESRPISTSNNIDDDDDHSITSTTSRISSRIKHLKNDILPQSWSPWDALKVFSGDPVLAEVGKIAFLYYTAVWAVVSTLMLYAAKHFHLSPERLGELMSALGLSTMIAEAVLVRIIVPVLGEKQAMKLGLLAFTLQCTLLGFANQTYQLFLCVAFSTLANLVYPSLSSLVSNAVAPDAVGEALGAVNGIKALTEGVGPLFFGTLMTLSENTALPGWPYLIAAGFSLLAFRQTDYLPDENDNDYLSEKYNWNINRDRIRKKYMSWLIGDPQNEPKSITLEDDQTESDEELVGLLSELDTDSSAISD